MIAVERSGIELDHCISCRGLWFDRGELDLLAELTRADLRSIDAAAAGGVQKSRRCPRCGAPLEEFALETLRIDRCPKGDGLWFDRGELGALIDRGLAAAGPLLPVTSFLGEVFGARPEGGEEGSGS